MKTCTKCGCVYDDSFAACPTCNKTVETSVNTKNKKCFVCKKDLPELTDRCPYCGQYIRLTKGQILGILGFICIILTFCGKYIFIIPGIILMLCCLKYTIPDAIKMSNVQTDNSTNTTNRNNKISSNNAVKSETQTNKQTYAPKKHIPTDEILIKKYFKINSKDDDTRILRAKYEPFTIKNLDEVNKTADILNKDKNTKYHTTLTSCTCMDFQKRSLPCKHMYRLAAKLGYYPLYREEEQEAVERLWVLRGEDQLITKLIDVFYRIRDKKNKYYIKTSPNLNKLKELGLININKIPAKELLAFKYNANELKGILSGKDLKKSITKPELIELYMSDEKLMKKLPKNIFHITLNFSDKQKEYLTECLYAILNNFYQNY